MSLSELKAQNEPSAEAGEEIEEVEPELIEQAEEVENPEKEEKLEDNEDEAEESKDPKELEDWQKSEQDEDSKSKFVPNAEAKNLRLKNKDLKAQKEQNELELEELRQKVDALSGQKPQEQAEALPPRPKLEDHDYDEDRHAEALDDWYDKKLDLKIHKTQNQSIEKSQQIQQQQAQEAQKEEAVTAHLNRAAKLINDKVITQDKWLTGDKLIRQTLDLVMPGNGNAVADQFISLMEQNGSGSEKAWYYLGRNPAALTTFRDKVMSDKTGASAIMYLASIQQKASQPTRKKNSDTPPPAANLKGDGKSVAASQLQKQYSKSGDLQTRISLKRKAKAAGEDVSNW